MYRHTSSALGLAALAGSGLHAGGINLIWAPVVAATGIGVALSLTHIAVGLGAPHPANLIAGLRRRIFSGSSEVPST